MTPEQQAAWEHGFKLRFALEGIDPDSPTVKVALEKCSGLGDEIGNWWRKHVGGKGLIKSLGTAAGLGSLAFLRGPRELALAAAIGLPAAAYLGGRGAGWAAEKITSPTEADVKERQELETLVNYQNALAQVRAQSRGQRRKQKTDKEKTTELFA